MDKRALRSNSNNSSPAIQKSTKGTGPHPDSPVTLSDLKIALADCVSQINERIDTVINTRLEKLRCDIQSDFERKINHLESTIAAQATEIEALRVHHTGVATQIDSLAYTLHQQMKKDIEKNIVLSGIAEDMDESAMPPKAKDVLDKLDCSRCEIVQHSRVGKSQNNKPRLLKISFRFLHDKIKATRNASCLRGDARFQGVYVNSDLTFCERQERKRLRNELTKRKNENPAADIFLRRDKLLVDDVVMDSAEPHRLLFRAHNSTLHPQFRDFKFQHSNFSILQHY